MFPIIGMFKRFWPQSILIVLILIVFGNSLTFEFVFIDDNIHVESNPHLKKPVYEALETFWSEPYKRLYIPLTYTFWMLPLVFLEKPDPQVYHLLNLLLHLSTCLFLVFPLLRRLTESSQSALWGAALFAVHPLQVEPVVWISGGKDLLSIHLVLAALLLHIKYWETGRGAYRGGAAIVFFMALLAKPVAVVAPVCLFLLGRFRYRKGLIVLVQELLLWGVAAIPIIWITFSLQQNSRMRWVVPGLLERGLIALDALGFYLTKFFVPLNLTVDYGKTPAAAMASKAIYLTSLFPLIFFMLLMRFKRLGGWLGFLLFVVALGPVLGLKPFVFQTLSTVSDRFMYLPLLGLILMCSKIFSSIYMPVGLRRSIALGSVLLCTLLSFKQVSVWRNSRSVLEHMIAQNDSWFAHNNLGVFYEQEQNWEKARHHYTESARVHPHFASFTNIAAVELHLGNYEAALRAFERAREESPFSAKAYHNLGVVWALMGNKHKAKEFFRLASNMDPRFTTGIQANQQNLGILKN